MADFLSRYQDNEGKNNGSELIVANILKNFSPNLSKMLKNISIEQKNDAYTAKIRETYMQINKINKFDIINDILCQNDLYGHLRVVLPEKILTLMIAELHEIYIHIGSQKLFNLMREIVTGRYMKKKIKKYCKTCDKCQRTKYLNKKYTSCFQPIIIKNPRELISIDFFGPLPTSTAGAKYILTTIDVFSKYVHMYPIKNATANICVRKICDHYVKIYGKIEKIMCDHGSQFTAKKWIEKLKSENIKLVYSSIRHPQSNIVERMHRELGRFFRCLVKDKHTAWARYIKEIMEVMNNTHHETTKYMPSELFLNKKSIEPWKSHFKKIGDIQQLDYVEKLEKARENCATFLNRRAEKINRNKKHFVFYLGQKVLIKSDRRSDAEKNIIAKFQDIYEGPYYISRIVNKDTYELIDPFNNLKGNYHISNLREYFLQDEK